MKFLTGLALKNVFLAGPVKLISKRADMLSVDIWESVARAQGRP